MYLLSYTEKRNYVNNVKQDKKITKKKKRGKIGYDAQSVFQNFIEYVIRDMRPYFCVTKDVSDGAPKHAFTECIRWPFD
jgi:hypothetical protein